MAENGNRQWLLWLSGIVATLSLSGVSVLANNVVLNDRIRQKEDAELMEKSMENRERIAKLEECMIAAKGDISTIKLDVKEILRMVK